MKKSHNPETTQKGAQFRPLA
nr:unnamed protein product [Callosobruchus chinensis]